MRIALAQINPTVGDIESNCASILEIIRECLRQNVQVVVFPELCLVGYPPKDLVFREDFLAANLRALETIARSCRNIMAILGFLEPGDPNVGKGIFNSAAVCAHGAVLTTYAKMLLPTYDVFDEFRYFTCGNKPQIIELPTQPQKTPAGLTICEDLWNNRQFEGRRVYGVDPIVLTASAGAKMILNISASPYRTGVEAEREALFANQTREVHAGLVYVNQVGGNDDLIFDGASLVLSAAGEVLARAAAFREDLLIVDLDSTGPSRIEPRPQPLEAMRKALVLGVRDYVRKCGFQDVVLGLSGGIDSALTAVIAVEALGAAHVHGVALPSRFTSDASNQDARILAGNLGISLHHLPIESVHSAFEQTLAAPFQGTLPGVTEENVQARIRGNLLMALSNKFGWLLLNTGNKSELATGYCTLYGDMCGGLGVLMDVSKTSVYALARMINREAGREIIPQRTIDRTPTAELRPNQTDLDTLPPYELLDPILEQYVEFQRSVEQIAGMGYDIDLVQRVARMVDASEYKRKQAPVGLKVTRKAFGTGRRMPIAARYRIHV